LALGEEIDADETLMLKAFVAGFETASRAGFGLGEAVTARGWHGTGIFGRLGAAAASAVLLGLDAERTLHALGLAATQASGLSASFGTMAKPFHAGKAAMDGIIAAELAGAGLVGATSVLEPGGGLDAALVQDGSRRITPADFSEWAILDNSFKPYAACHLTHPAVDAARALLPRIGAIGRLEAVHAAVGALALQVTGEKSGVPATPLEGKFDLKYCVALALHGHVLSAADFRVPWRPDPAVCATARRVTVEADPEFSFASARVAIDFADGAHADIAIPVAKGHPGNPMSWDDMAAKFTGLTELALGRDSVLLLTQAREFGERPGALEAMRALLAAAARPAAGA
jgi:2-methylcitrate dehydratase PrpD